MRGALVFLAVIGIDPTCVRQRARPLTETPPARPRTFDAPVAEPTKARDGTYLISLHREEATKGVFVFNNDGDGIPGSPVRVPISDAARPSRILTDGRSVYVSDLKSGIFVLDFDAVRGRVTPENPVPIQTAGGDSCECLGSSALDPRRRRLYSVRLNHTDPSVVGFDLAPDGRPVTAKLHNWKTERVVFELAVDPDLDGVLAADIEGELFVMKKGTRTASRLVSLDTTDKRRVARLFVDSWQGGLLYALRGGDEPLSTDLVPISLGPRPSVLGVVAVDGQTGVYLARSAIAATRTTVYATSNASGLVAAFGKTKDGHLEQLRSVSLDRKPATHVALHPNGRTLYALADSVVFVFGLDADGAMAPRAQVKLPAGAVDFVLVAGSARGVETRVGSGP